MHITVFGAAGNVGRRVVAEAAARQHDVTAVVRDPARIGDLHPAARGAVGDAHDPDQVAALAAGQDVVVGATRPVAGHEQDHVLAARALLAGAGHAGVRLVIVGGAGSLVVPGTGGTTVIDDPRFLSAAYRPIAQACTDQLAACRAEPRVDWTYLSPAASLEPGARTGVYRTGTDELLVDARGRSHISMEDLAVALLDEVEHPRHRRRRFTVAY